MLKQIFNFVRRHFEMSKFKSIFEVNSLKILFTIKILFILINFMNHYCDCLVLVTCIALVRVTITGTIGQTTICMVLLLSCKIFMNIFNNKMKFSLFFRWFWYPF